MQNSKENRGRADRREDARRQNREQESVTAYRPRTRHRIGEQDLEGNEKREVRPRRTEQRQASGSYRPRTAKREFVPRHRTEEAAPSFRDRGAEEGTERREDFRSERSHSHRERRQRVERGEEKKSYVRGEQSAERKERRFDRDNKQREERSLGRKRNRDRDNERDTARFRDRKNREYRPTYGGDEEEFSQSHRGRGTRSQRRSRSSEVLGERGKEGLRRGKERQMRERQDFRPQERLGEEIRERCKRSEERIGSAAPFGRTGRNVTTRSEYFEGLDSELMGREQRREFRGEKKLKGRRNESYAAARDSRREREESNIHTPLDLNQPMRLNRYIAHCGQCSRRDADEMITRGEITVNGAVVTTLGEKVIPANDIVTRNGDVLKLEQKVYILLNKPKDTFCTVEDEHAERTVLDLVKDACAERIYPVGRLDRNTTGLLLLTNDGDLTEKLTHPSYAKRKTYEVTLDRKVTPQDMEQLRAGVTLEDDTFVQVDEIAYVRPDDNCTVGVTIHTGQNRVVRRMFDTLGFRVERLDRVLYAGLTKRNLPRGTWRFLTDDEIRMLKNDSYR